MEEEYLKKIRTLSIKALFSDSDLMNLLVLKGGNLLDIIYKISLRSSIDLDFSIENEFKKNEFKKIRNKISKSLKNTFKEAGYIVFDINFSERPKKISAKERNFWGGYFIEFKIIEIEKYSKFKKKLDSLRRNASVVGPNQRKKFKIEISKFEYCAQKQKKELEGLTVFVYSPLMIIYEKLRSICQQMPEYKMIVKSHPQTARARDFLDIYVIFENFKVDIRSKESIELLKNIFSAKKVPIEQIGKIKEYREFHRQDFVAVKDTVKPGIKLKDFDFYFNYVTKKCEDLKSLWKE